MRMVMVDRHLVHDLSSNCPQMINLRKELSQGRGCYTSVRTVQARVYKIPGCRVCFGTDEAFRQLIRTV